MSTWTIITQVLTSSKISKFGIGACGTVRVDRKGLPDIFTSTLRKSEVRTRRLNGGVLALQWQDKRQCCQPPTALACQQSKDGHDKHKVA